MQQFGPIHGNVQRNSSFYATKSKKDSWFSSTGFFFDFFFLRSSNVRCKLAVAGIIEGNLSEEGLAAMSDVKDLTSQMAKELALGIKDNVEDIAAGGPLDAG